MLVHKYVTDCLGNLVVVCMSAVHEVAASIPGSDLKVLLVLSV